MSLRGIAPLLRCAIYSAPLAVLAVTIAVSPAAMAQTQSSNGFASSSQVLIADAAMPAGASAAAAPVSGAAGQSASYGYRSHDWSSHLTFEGGAGANAPIGNDTPVITWGGNFTVGGGYKFTDRVSLLAEYQFMDDKLPGALIADAGAQGGSAHIWSFSLDPVIDLLPKKKNSVYLTGGAGFYRKLTSFTDPEEVEECYYFCGVGYENVVVGHFSSNQAGLNLGVGITHKLGSPSTGGDDRLRVYAEARYLWIDTPGINATDGLGTTELIPVTLGVRW